jgi:hypothetical protein
VGGREKKSNEPVRGLCWIWSLLIAMCSLERDEMRRAVAIERDERDAQVYSDVLT